MLNPPVVFDCVEFSESLRIGDVVSELHSRLAESNGSVARIWRRDCWRNTDGRSGDSFPIPLASFYKAYRACVRAKVDVLRARQLPETSRPELEREIERYLHLASFHAAEFHRPILAITVGASGTGKSTVAEILAKELAFEHLRTDTIRAHLAGRRAPKETYGQGQYTTSMTDKVYETLFDQAKELLSDAGAVVLDGTFREKRFRETARELARRMGAQFLLLHCRCDPEIAEQRILERIERGTDPSDARPDFHRRQLEEMADADDLWNVGALVLDTSRTKGQVLNHIVDRIRQELSL
ncbi:MAG: AAA family ATPase [Planctomycetota bacterium]